MLGSRDANRNAGITPPKKNLIVGQCCNNACKNGGTASRREGVAGYDT